MVVVWCVSSAAAGGSKKLRYVLIAFDLVLMEAGGGERGGSSRGGSGRQAGSDFAFHFSFFSTLVLLAASASHCWSSVFGLHLCLDPAVQ